jgi:peptidyl-prolyl cis-trans isomerase D
VLKFMRRNARATWVRFTFMAIVLVFIFWGIGAGVGMMGDRADVVARVNRDTIDPTHFRRAEANLERMYQQIYKDSMPPEMLKALDLPGKALDQLIRTSLLQQEAARIGLQVGDEELAESIQSMPVFQDGGAFLKERYLAVLRAQNPPIQPGEFEAAQRDDLLVRKIDDIVGAGVQVTDAELKEQYHAENDRVDLDFARVKASDFADQVHPADADLQTYFDAHQEDFRVPERVRIEFLAYKPAAFESEVTVSDVDAQDYYDTHREKFDKPEEVQARHILLNLGPNAKDDEKAKVRKQAEEILAQAKGGADFAELAKQHSQDPGSASKGGDLGFFKRGQMVPAFDQAAFALAPGQISELVESPFGFHIIKVEAKHAAETPTLDQVRSQVVDAIKQERSRDVAGNHARADRDKVVSGGGSLDAVGAANGVTLMNPPAFARTELIAGIGREAKLSDAAFASAVNDIPDVIETPGAFYVLRIAEKIPSRIPELATVRDDVDKAFHKQKTEELAKAKADGLLAALKQQNNFGAFAAANGLTVEQTGPFTRAGTYVPKLGTQADLKKAAFELTKDHPVAPAVYQATGDAVLAALKEIVPADDAKFEEQKDTLRQQTIERRRGLVSEQFVNELKARARIEINQDVLASLSETGTAPRRRR